MTDLDADLKAYRRDQKFRNRVIEECALEVVRIGPKPFHEIVAAIRALKDKL